VWASVWRLTAAAPMFECSGTVPTMKMYNDSACEVADSAQDVVYSGEKVCESSGGTMWTKRTCGDLDLGESKMYSDSACAVLVDEGLFSGALCSKLQHGRYNEDENAWQANSRQVVLSSDALSITSSGHETMDCSGDVDGNATTYTCGKCSIQEEEDETYWTVVNFPGCGPSASAAVSGAVAKAPALLLKAAALMLAKIACL